MNKSAHKGKTLSGVKWSLIGQFIVQFLSILFGAILARLISPEDYGLIGMVTIVSGFLVVITNLNIGAAVIQKSEITSDELSTVYWLNIFINLGITLIIIVLAPLIASFYNEPQLINIARILALTFIIKSFGGIPSNLITKRMDFKSMLLINLITVSSSSIIAIILAYNEFEVWAIVYQHITLNILSAIVPYFFISWRPKFIFKPKLLGGFLRFGIPLLAESSINYWVRNLDNILIAKFWGASSLGFYNKAYQLMLIPVSQVAGSIKRVMFPSFAGIQNDLPLLQVYYINTIKTLSFITFPLMGGLFVLSYPTIELVYGPNWAKSASILQILCFVGALQSISTVAGSVFLAIGATKKMLKISILIKALMITGILIGLNYGIEGVAIGYSAGSLAGFLPELYYTGNMIGLSILTILKSLIKNFICTFLMALIVYSIYNLTLFSSILANFTLTVAIGMISYFLFSYLINRKMTVDIFNEVKKQFS